MQIIQRVQGKPEFNDVWQIKLIDLYMEKFKQPHILLASELMGALLEKFKVYIENTRRAMAPILRSFISSSSLEPHIINKLSTVEVARLYAVINFYNLTPNLLILVDLSGTVNYLRYLYEFKKLKLDVQTIHCLIKILLQTNSNEAT